MSTPFYDLASLVVLPSGYKSQKIYAQKPLTTDGQLTFTRASTATRVNASGLIASVASGVPRLDYLNSTCPKLLLEPQRTNSVTYSEQFNNAAWALDGDGAGQSVTANYATSPDGTQNADRIQLNYTGGSYSRIRQDYVASGTHTISVYLKSNTGSSQKIWMRVDGSTKNKITITTAWQRFVVSGSTAAALELFIDVTDAEIATIADFSAWGAQLEAGAYATSYIPTTSAAVTRVADSASKTGANVFFGTNTGTIVINFDSVGFDPTQGNYVFDLAAGVDAANRILVYFSPSDNTLRLFYARTDGTNAQQSFVVTMSAIKKVAVKWTASSIKMFYNGTATNSFAFGATAPNDLTLFARYTDNEHLAARASQVLTFPTALTDAQCIELTTL